MSTRNKRVITFRIVLIIFSLWAGSLINILYHISQQKTAAQMQTTLTQPFRLGLQKTAGFSLYRNSTFGITIQYPSTWLLNDKHLSAANYTYGDIQEIIEINPRSAHIFPSFSLFVGSIRPNTTLNAYLGNTIQSYRDDPTGFPNFTLISNTKNIMLAGNPGYEISYSYDIKPYTVLAIEIGTFIDDKVYEITYLSDAKQYDSFLPDINKMIDSLRLNIHESNTMGKSNSTILKDLTPQDIAGL